MSTIKIAIIGCSAIADKTVLPTIIGNPLFTLVMVGSRSKEKAEVFAAKYNCQPGSYEDVLNSPIVQAIYVSVPTGLHFEYGKKVLESGKHLLLEKPFTSNIAQANNLIDLAKKNNLIAMEGLAYVYHPYFLKLKEILLQGAIGQNYLIESSFGFPSLPSSDIRNQKDIGGGAILDNLIYPLSLSLELFGPGYLKKDYYVHFNEEFQIDDRGFLRLDWKNQSAHLSYGFGFAYKNIFQIWGSEGSITVDRAFTKPANMIAEIIVQNANGIEKIEVGPSNQFHLMLNAFSEKINGSDTSCKNEKEDILSRMKIISEMYQSLEDSYD